MAYERYPRGNSLQGDYYARGDDNYTRDYGSGADYAYSSARDYEAAGMIGPRRQGRGDYGRGYYSRGNADFDNRGYNEPYRGSYASDGHRFTDVGPRADYGRDRDYGRPDMYRGRDRFGRDPGDYNYDDRGFLSRAGDEVRSWFGDEEAERRREADQRHDQFAYGPRFTGYRGDDDYHSWRAGQIAALDRDYDEYRRENQQRFSNEFGSWRSERQTQRSSLDRVAEHMEVVGSDGEHIGTVDKVRGDRIVLTKSDPDAGGRHHSIPSRWIQNVDDKVTVRKTADEAKSHWRDEERSAFFGGDSAGRNEEEGSDGRILNRSFSGTY